MAEAVKRNPWWAFVYDLVLIVLGAVIASVDGNLGALVLVLAVWFVVSAFGVSAWIERKAFRNKSDEFFA